MANGSGAKRSMADSIRRFVNVIRILGLVFLLGVVATGVRSLILFYSNQVGLSAPDAARTYVGALTRGDLDTVYSMTDPASLTDLYGRSVERTVFMANAREVLGSDRPSVQGIEVEKVFDRNGVHYIRADISYYGNGSTTKRSLLLQLRNEDGTWLVAWPFGLGS